MNKTVMRATDTIKGAEATAYVTIDGTRYTLLNLKSFESSIDFTNGSVNRLGALMVGHKQGLGEGKWSATMYYGSPMFRELIINYKKSGYFPPITISTTNNDSSASIGKQRVIHKNCLIDSAILSKIDVDTEFLEEDISGTFDDFEIPQKFTPYDGMI